GAGGEVEVGVAHPPAGDERDPQVRAGDGRRGTGAAAAGQHSGHRRSSGPTRWTRTDVGSALADRGCTAAWSSPGAPHRGGGLPASEPGLRTGALDLRGRLRADVVIGQADLLPPPVRVVSPCGAPRRTRRSRGRSGTRRRTARSRQVPARAAVGRRWGASPGGSPAPAPPDPARTAARRSPPRNGCATGSRTR